MADQGIKSYKEVARIVGVSPRTLYNWRKQEEFSEAYNKEINDLKERVESSSEFQIQLEALGDKKNYKATSKNQVEITNVINPLIERINNLMEKQEDNESKLEALSKTAEQMRNNLIQIKKDIEKIKTKISED